MAMVLHPEDQPGPYLEMFERLLTGERLDYPDTVRIRKDGQTIRVSVYISPIKNGNGEVTGFSGMIREISGDQWRLRFGLWSIGRTAVRPIDTFTNERPGRQAAP